MSSSDESQMGFWSEEPPASPLALPDCDEAWMTRVVTWPSDFFDLLIAHAPGGWSGRTSPACCHPPVVSQRVRRQTVWEWDQASESWLMKSTTKKVISPASLPRWQNSGMAAATECWTLSTSEWTATLVPSPSDAGVCSLSAILETGDLPRRYYLSAKACRGILRRAETWGGTLPSQLHHALEAGAKSPSGKKM